MRIVVVDDDPSIRALLTVELELAGHVVAVAVDGVEGLSLIRRDPPDAVVLDVMMPVVTGWQVLAAVRAAPGTRQLPVVLLTARDLPDDVRRGYELGASAVLSKPHSAAALLDVLAALHQGLQPCSQLDG